MAMIEGQKIRRVMLETIYDLSKGRSHLQSGMILGEIASRLEVRADVEMEQAILTFWYDLFRTGYLAWGYNLTNPDPPFCHLTEQGRRSLENLSRDPANPDGYIKHLSEVAEINSIARSYLLEALHTYNVDCYKAAAIMVGAATESILLEVRDKLTDRITDKGETPPRNLKDWKVKTMIAALKKILDDRKKDLPYTLAEAYEAYWPAFTQQIRTARNEAGHPLSIEPVTHETVHASLLIFPELAKLAHELKGWINSNY